MYSSKYIIIIFKYIAPWYVLILSRYFWGYVTDKLGRRPVLLLSAVLTYCATIFFGFSTDLYSAMLGRFLQGLSNGMCHIFRLFFNMEISSDLYLALYSQDRCFDRWPKMKGKETPTGGSRKKLTGAQVSPVYKGCDAGRGRIMHICGHAPFSRISVKIWPGLKPPSARSGSAFDTESEIDSDDDVEDDDDQIENFEL